MVSKLLATLKNMQLSGSTVIGIYGCIMLLLCQYSIHSNPGYIDVNAKETTTPATAKLDVHAQAQLKHNGKGHSFASKSKSDIHLLILTIILIPGFNFIF